MGGAKISMEDVDVLVGTGGRKMKRRRRRFQAVQLGRGREVLKTEQRKARRGSCCAGSVTGKER